MDDTKPGVRDNERSALPRSCRNCDGGLAAGDAYCPHCGQETHIALPTARQFMREAAGRYVALDGRLLRTLRALLLKPGFLTKEYFAGRRRRYVRPGRLFLVTSIVAFAAIRFAADAPINLVVNQQRRDVDAAATKKVKDAPAAPRLKNGERPSPAPDPAAALAAAGDEIRGEAAREAMDATIVQSDDLDVSMDGNFNVNVVRDRNGVLPAPLRERIDDYNRLPRDLKIKQVISNMFRFGPYAAIALLPAFAFLLMVVYPLPSRRYPRRPRCFAGHLVFAAHNHAFLFALVTLALVLPHVGIVGTLVTIAAPVYLVWSLRAVYGGGWVLTLVRAFVLFVAYAVLFGLVTLGLLAAAVILQ